jgi:hypothetical protein
MNRSQAVKEVYIGGIAPTYCGATRVIQGVEGGAQLRTFFST